MLYDFLVNLHNQPLLELPKTVQEIYSRVIQEAKNQFPDFQQYCKSQYKNLIYDDSPKGAKGQLYTFFHTHFFKFLHTLIRTELDLLTQIGRTNILAYPSVTLVDIGCGAGAASVALLSLLESYHKFLLDNNKTLSPIRVFLIGFDPSENMISLYMKMVEEYAHKLSPLLINVRYETLIEPFPQGVEKLTTRFHPINSYSVLLGMSNVIRPLFESFNAGETPWLEKVNQALRGEPVSSPEFAIAEARAIKSIIEQWQLDRVSLLSICTNGYEQKLNQMSKVIGQQISPHKSKSAGLRKEKLEFINPLDCYFSAGSKCPTEYYFNYSHFLHESYTNDKQWQDILQLSNLTQAWARSRRYALHEVLADETEIFLFDYEVEAKLARLHKQILAQEWKTLNVEHTLFFDAPKKPGAPRPKTVTRLEEQILATALIQRRGIKKQKLKASYSYYLNDKKDEFLYDNWLGAWKKFIKEAHKIAKYSNNVLRADIKKFYQKISQKKLLDVAKRILGIKERTEKLLEKLLLRDCGPSHESHYGIPQGHIASGFWADIYLAELDSLFLEELRGIKFARYADDMVFAVDSDICKVEIVKSELKNKLNSISLELSDEKTFPQEGSEYVSETTLDKEIEKLSNEFDRVVKYIYTIGKDYRVLYKSEPVDFVYKYNKLLRLIRVYVSEPWLRRKLEKSEHDSWLKQVFFWWKKSYLLTFPDFQEHEQEWLREFRDKNANWIKQVEQLRADFINLCLTSLEILSKESNGEETKRQEAEARRRLKFSVGRLCTLGLDEVADLLATEIIQRPWQVPVNILCRGLANCERGPELLLRISKDSDNPYVKALAIRALAEVRPQPPIEGIEHMWAMLQSDSTQPHEKLKASEALLFAERWETADFTVCRQLIETEKDPYLLKNYILMIGRAFKYTVRDYLEVLQTEHFQNYIQCLNGDCSDNKCHNLIVIDAIQYVLRELDRSNQNCSNNTDNEEVNLAIYQKECTLFNQGEPEILFSYYSAYYPVSESETVTRTGSP
ncbi:reverse transcriptase domain-containing protein [Aerosakkonema sp. BLCC-F183]|uniref:reverse transcriptase domain-containing protein n=1 Tax=Aerosakkonema sp. BLCC-F183 TaxID=3342834 RepID=UPI0035B7B984